jgi:hypothetical protein
LQPGKAVLQPTDLAIPVVSRKTDRSVRGTSLETSRQSLDLCVKYALQSKVGMVPLRGTVRWLNDRIGQNQCAHRFLLMSSSTVSGS